MVANYILLTCNVPVVKIERFAVILPSLKSINQYDPQTAELFSFKIKTTLNNELNKNYEWIYFLEKNKANSMVTNLDRFAYKP